VDEEVGKWVWGELPSTVVSTPVTTPTTTPAAKMGNGVKAPGASMTKIIYIFMETVVKTGVVVLCLIVDYEIKLF